MPDVLLHYAGINFFFSVTIRRYKPCLVNKMYRVSQGCRVDSFALYLAACRRTTHIFSTYVSRMLCLATFLIRVVGEA